MIHRIQRRYQEAVSALTADPVQPAYALREAFREGYGAANARADILAGLVVGVVALPLSMALAIASGVPPQHGLYTAIVAGFITALLGGSRTQVSGPTAAFVVLLVPVSTHYGVAGLLIASFMAGIILVIMGLAKAGRLIEFIPYPVTTGFTAGIAVVIASIQLRDFLGLRFGHNPEHFFDRVHEVFLALPTLQPADTAIGALTLAMLVYLPRVTRRIPAPLIALTAAAILAALLEHFFHGFSVATIRSRFSYSADGTTYAGIPPLPPLPEWPWNRPGPGSTHLVFGYALVRELLPSAFAIAMLGAIESLLSAVVSDGMAGTSHNPNSELLGLGIANMVAPFFGGFAATGAIARTATGVRAGARSPVASMTHAVFVLLSVLALAPLVGYLPMASLAALLLIVAWNMSEARHFARMLKIAPRSDVTVLLACFSLTVVFDMVVSVIGGIVLAALLFMRRMAEVSESRLFSESQPHPHFELPRGVHYFEVAGPLFFGAAQKAMSTLNVTRGVVRALVLDVSRVPAIDMTGIVNLESALDRLERDHIFVVIAGVQPQPARAFERVGLVPEQGIVAFAATVEEAIQIARVHAAGDAALRHGSGSSAGHVVAA
jgi:SulP family sulfate permease